RKSRQLARDWDLGFALELGDGGESARAAWRHAGMIEDAARRGFGRRGGYAALDGRSRGGDAVSNSYVNTKGGVHIERFEVGVTVNGKADTAIAKAIGREVRRE